MLQSSAPHLSDMEPSPFRWTFSKQKVLLEFFRNHESMYNPQHVDYRNRELRNRLLQQLKDMIGCEPSEAKSKFHSLRTYFTKELNKVRHSKLPGNGPVYSSRWELFHDMLFIKDAYQPRPIHPSSFKLSGASPSNADAAPMNADAAPTDVAFNDHELEIAGADVEVDTSAIEPAPQSPPGEVGNSGLCIKIQSPRTLKVAQRKRKRDPDCWSNGSTDIPVGAREAASALRNDEVKDEDFYFAMMMAKEMKHLRPLDKDILKLRMMEMIVEAKHNVALERCERVVQLTE